MPVAFWGFPDECLTKRVEYIYVVQMTMIAEVLQKHEVHAKVTNSIIPAKAVPPKAGQNRLNPAFSGTGFRVALRLPGMTISLWFQEFCKPPT